MSSVLQRTFIHAELINDYRSWCLSAKVLPIIHFPSFLVALIDGCHFHYCQAILRNVNILGYKTSYEAVPTELAKL